jgi:DNA-binding MarR family transcriptional regulator
VTDTESRPSTAGIEPRYLLLEPMRGIERAVHAAMLRRLADAGYHEIRVPHIALLAHMTTEGRRLTEFAELMQVTKSAVSQLVTQLEQAGLLERVPDPTDARAVLIRATPRAEKGFRIARALLADLEREWERLLGADQLTHLSNSLKLLEDWSRTSGEHARTASTQPPESRSRL